MRTWILAGAIALVGCAQETCPDVLPECPEGTTLTIISESKSVFNASVVVEDNRADADGDSYTYGECSYSCVANTVCPEGTAELYTEDCFTCAPLDEEGLLVEPHDCTPVDEPETQY